MKYAWAWVLGAAVALHLGLLSYFTPNGLLFSGMPIHTFDYALHVYQVKRALAAFESTGHLWSYDPVRARGQARRRGGGSRRARASSCSGLFSAVRLGVNPFIAFNVYVFLVHWGVPLAGWKAARLLDLSRLGAALTVFFWRRLLAFSIRCCTGFGTSE